MHLTNEDPKARDIVAVLLDGKVCPKVIEFDDEEGWVVALRPPKKLELKEADPNDPSQQKDALLDQEGLFDWEEVKLTGEVKVIWTT